MKLPLITILRNGKPSRISPKNAVSSFAPSALAYLVVDRLRYEPDATILQKTFLQHMWVGWPMYLFVIYIEFFSIVAVFRSELHRFWGISLMVFHFSVWLLMGVSFPYQPMTVALLYIFSPFAPTNGVPISSWFRSLPLFGEIVGFYRWLKTYQSAKTTYQ